MGGYDLARGRAAPAPAPATARAGGEAAPAGLELVRLLINSSDVEAGTDTFATPAGVESWFRARDLPVGRDGVSDTDRARLVAFREALRGLLADRQLGTIDRDSIEVLEAAARSNPLTVSFGLDGQSTLQVEGVGVDGLIGRVLGEIATASLAGTWARLKVCRNDACRWAFYDGSRNHSGIWCSMAICGNRSKGRALRVRRKGTGTAA